MNLGPAGLPLQKQMKICEISSLNHSDCQITIRGMAVELNCGSFNLNLRSEHSLNVCKIHSKTAAIQAEIRPTLMF